MRNPRLKSPIQLSPEARIKGLAKSQMGIVLVTPAMLKTLPAAGVADKELSVLIAECG